MKRIEQIPRLFCVGTFRKGPPHGVRQKMMAHYELLLYYFKRPKENIKSDYGVHQRGMSYYCKVVAAANNAAFYDSIARVNVTMYSVEVLCNHQNLNFGKILNSLNN